MRRRIHIEPDEVSQLGGKLRIVGELEQMCSVRLQTVPAPDALKTIRSTQLNFNAGAHPADSHSSDITRIPNWTQMSDFIH